MISIYLYIYKPTVIMCLQQAQNHQTFPLIAHISLLPFQEPCKPHFYSSLVSENKILSVIL